MIDGRSAWTPFGLSRNGLLHDGGLAGAGERITKTPIRGPASVAQIAFGGGQSEAQTESSLVSLAARDFPGFQAKGAEARCSANADPGRATPARTTTVATTLNTRLRARPDIDGIVPAVASRPAQARVPERYTGVLNTPAKGMA
jgi:hypothetical protein